jgi:1-acyl-sn-glycerol-3-phosphate acyltransferase
MAAIHMRASNRTSVPTRLVRLARLALHLIRGLLIVRFRYPGLSESERNKRKLVWSRKMLSILSISVRDQGPHRKLPQRCVLALNHISWLDMFVINARHPATFIAKSEIQNWPLVGPLCTGAGTLYIERGKRAGALRAKRTVADALDREAVIAFFPEGTTSYGRSLGRFHPALFQPALDAGAVLQPVALRYLDVAGAHNGAAAYAGESSLIESVWAIVSTRHIVTEVRLLDPIPTAGETRRSLAERAEAAIAAALEVPVPHRVSPSGPAHRAPDRRGGPPAGSR